MQALFSVRHNTPGRLRLKVKKKKKLLEVSKLSSAIAGVSHTRVNEACSSLLILYDIQKATADNIMANLASSPSKESECQLSVCSCNAPKEPHTFKRQIKRFVILSGVMGYIFVKEILLKATLAQAALSPLGIIALAASVPLFRESWQHAKEKRFTLEGFLAAGCALAAFSGQAITALEILWIQSGAESLNAWVSERSRQSVSEILALTAKNTFILVGEVELEVPVSAVKPRDIVVLHTGEKVSVDGTVISGDALLDDSPITGRAELAHAIPGVKVFAGSYVHQGVLHVRAECVGDRTYLARIMKEVEDNLENKAPIETVADGFAKNMVKLGLLATAGTFFITGSLWRAFTVMMVMACPCATVLSAQTAVSAAMSGAAKRGILIKGGRYLEEVGTAEVVCFDKTGTLTTSEPKIETIINFSDLTEDELLLWAYSAEVHNHHPLALAIKKEALTRQIDPLCHVVCDFTLGKGVRALIGEDEIRLGNRRYLKEAGIDTKPVEKQVKPLANKGLTVIFLAKNDSLLAAFGFANELRQDAKQTVAALSASGVKKVALITGDTKNTAQELCHSLGITHCHDSVLPEEKGAIVADLKAQGRKVIMVGDGINDALALAEADIGIAMSADGADVAIEAADIALVTNDLADILYIRDLSRKTVRIAHENFWIATSTNIGGAIAGALGILSPVTAGLIHIVHTLGVLANSSRLLRVRPHPLPVEKETQKSLPTLTEENI